MDKFCSLSAEEIKRSITGIALVMLGLFSLAGIALWLHPFIVTITGYSSAGSQRKFFTQHF